MLSSIRTPYFTRPSSCFSFGLNSYSFSFNGMEKIEDINGNGNALDFGARIYDARLGRWLSVDNRFKEIPSEAPYVGIGNMPIKFYDPDGNKIICEDKNTQKEVLKAINSQALGQFDFNSKGELCLVTKRGDETKYSKYFQDQLIKAIDDKTNSIIIRKADKVINEETGKIQYLSEYGEGLTNNLIPNNNDDPLISKVYFSGKTTTDKNENFVDMTITVDEIIMHELVGHGIPYTTGSDTGDAVENENKVRVQNGKMKRHETSGHKEFKKR